RVDAVAVRDLRDELEAPRAFEGRDQAAQAGVELDRKDEVTDSEILLEEPGRLALIHVLRHAPQPLIPDRELEQSGSRGDERTDAVDDRPAVARRPEHCERLLHGNLEDGAGRQLLERPIDVRDTG